MKVPCEECISYAICVNSKGIVSLLRKCYMLRDYVQTETTLRIAIETLSIKYDKDTLNSIVPLVLSVKSTISEEYNE